VHDLPDGPRSSQDVNLASLVLGHHGIWGDLAALPAPDVEAMAQVLLRYRQVRDDATAAPPVRGGPVAGSPEVHEKLRPETGRGVVAVFSTDVGRFTVVTSHPVADGGWCSGTSRVVVTRLPSGRARLDVDFAEPGAVLVLFGTREGSDG
jgi:hypothetical protein